MYYFKLKDKTEFWKKKSVKQDSLFIMDNPATLKIKVNECILFSDPLLYITSITF